MHERLVLLLMISTIIHTMDYQSIDMMVLKKAGIEKLREAVRNSHPPVRAQRMGSDIIDILPGMTFELTHTIYTGNNQNDPFITAVWRRIMAIESTNSYHHNLWLGHDGTSVMPTNYLDKNTRYWRKIDKDTDAPYILVQSIFYEPDLLKKALEELGAPYRECTIL